MTARVCPPHPSAARASGLRLDHERLVYRRRRPSLLVVDWVRINGRGKALAWRSKKGRNQDTTLILMLASQVMLPERLEIESDAEIKNGSVPMLVIANAVGLQ